MALGAGSNILQGITWIIMVGAVIVVAIPILNGSIDTNYFRNHFILTTVKINNLTLNVHVAKTPAEQIASLNNIKSISRNEGMLFVFDKDGRYSISTTDMLFPVDLMWLDSNGNILDAQANVAPGLRDPVQTQSYARYVLMVNAGVMDQNDITVHSSADISGVK